MEGINNYIESVVGRNRYGKKIKILRNSDVKVFEKDINDFIDSHEVINLIYKPIYRTEYRDIVYTCCIEYIDVIKED